MIAAIGPAADALVVAATAPVELAAAAFVAVAGLKAIGWDLVILGFATDGRASFIPFALTASFRLFLSRDAAIRVSFLGASGPDTFDFSRDSG